MNYFTQELIVGDDRGCLSFIKIFNKSEIKLKVNQQGQKIIFLQTLEIFNDQEHILVVTEDNLDICRIKRETKILNVHYHDAEIIKLFVVDPVKSVISAGLDNKIKIWDFLTMESINVIEGPELKNKNMEISTICYLKNLSLVAVGTDIGKVFFWDLNKSIYLNNDYENFLKHKTFVTCIINIGERHGKEIMMSCGLEGSILIWEIEGIESKEGNRNRQSSLPNKNKLKKLEKFDFFSDSNENELKLPMIDSNSIKIRSSHYVKYIPQIKTLINTGFLLSQSMSESSLSSDVKSNYKISHSFTHNHQINVLNYSQLTENYLYSGGVDCNVNIWNFYKNTFVQALVGHTSPISCMTFDRHYLFTGSLNGQIFVWNTFDFSCLMTIGEISSYRVTELMMMPKYGLLVTITGNKKLNFWKYESKELVKSVLVKQDPSCFSIVESYGKLLCGTKDKTIVEFDLTEILSSVDIQHDYKKFHFLDSQVNYEKDESKIFIYSR